MKIYPVRIKDPTTLYYYRGRGALRPRRYQLTIRNYLFLKQGGKCALCGFRMLNVNKGDRGVTIDHIVPQSKGGSHDIENLQAACSKCNRSKGDQEP